jgi:hypothetical protein
MNVENVVKNRFQRMLIIKKISNVNLKIAKTQKLYMHSFINLNICKVN